MSRNTQPPTDKFYYLRCNVDSYHTAHSASTPTSAFSVHVKHFSLVQRGNLAFCKSRYAIFCRTRPRAEGFVFFVCSMWTAFRFHMPTQSEAPKRPHVQVESESSPRALLLSTPLITVHLHGREINLSINCRISNVAMLENVIWARWDRKLTWVLRAASPCFGFPRANLARLDSIDS